MLQMYMLEGISSPFYPRPIPRTFHYQLIIVINEVEDKSQE